MKRKILTVLTASLLAMSMLAGCGASGSSLGSNTTPKDIVDSKEPVIAYISEGYAKDAKPKMVMVFENGVGTVYKTGDYTMGDFANMTDEEVINSLVALIEEKNNKQLEEYQSSLEECQSNIDNLDTQFPVIESLSWIKYMDLLYKGGSDYLTEEDYMLLETNPAIYEYLISNNDFSNITLQVAEALFNFAISGADGEFGQSLSLAEDWKAYTERHDGEKFSGIFQGYINTNKYDLEDVTEATIEFDRVLTEAVENCNELLKADKEIARESYQASIDNYNQKITELQSEESVGENYKAVIDLMTDETGNAVLVEVITLLSEDDIEYAIALKGAVYTLEDRKPIYDSQYAVYGVSSDGSNVAGFMLIRDNSKNGVTFGMDTLDTKDVYIDVEEFEDFTE